MRDMKKERVKNIIKVIVFMLIFCGFMALGSVMLYPKTSDPEAAAYQIQMPEASMENQRIPSIWSLWETVMPTVHIHRC